MVSYLTKLYYAALTASILVSCSSEKPAVKTEKTTTKTVLEPIIKQKPKPLPETSLDTIVGEEGSNTTSLNSKAIQFLYGPINSSLHDLSRLVDPAYSLGGFSSFSYLDAQSVLFGQRLNDNCVSKGFEETRRSGFPLGEEMRKAIQDYCKHEMGGLTAFSPSWFSSSYKYLMIGPFGGSVYGSRIPFLGHDRTIPLPDTSYTKNKKKK